MEGQIDIKPHKAVWNSLQDLAGQTVPSNVLQDNEVNDKKV